MNHQRKKTLQFHVESRDYFVSLATTLGLVEEMVENELLKISHASKEIKQLVRTLDKISDDLLFLQEEYDLNLKASKSSK